MIYDGHHGDPEENQFKPITASRLMYVLPVHNVLCCENLSLSKYVLLWATKSSISRQLPHNYKTLLH